MAGAISQVPVRSCVVVDPRHAWKLHAREPGDLGDACCQPDRTAGEGLGRKARMHVPEESDSGVVPMNHSNKVEQSMAEGEEGRPLIKENIHRSSTRPTQSGARVSQGLAGVRKAAREHKEMKFTALLHHVTVDLLRDSFSSLKRKAAPGVDGVTWQEYEAGLEGRLADLHSRVHRGAYRALPSRRVYIEKADGRKRPLGIAALEDKIVQHAVVTILNQIYEEDFLGFSYGFRPGTVRFQVGRYQLHCRNNARGAFHRPRFRGTVQNRIFSEACTDPSSCLRSARQVERTFRLSPARRLGFCEPA